MAVFGRTSILADAVEALIGAIFQDAGIEVCQERILGWYESRLNNLSLAEQDKDPKTLLQEYLQGKQKPLPEYRVVAASGEAHAQVFTVECTVPHLSISTQAQASNRRAAEKAAASQALDLLESKKRSKR